MKTAEEWNGTLANIHPAHRPLIWPSDYLDTIKQIQLDAISSAAKVCVDYANEMRGAHVHTGTASAEIKKRILGLISNSQ